MLCLYTDVTFISTDMVRMQVTCMCAKFLVTLLDNIFSCEIIASQRGILTQDNFVFVNYYSCMFTTLLISVDSCTSSLRMFCFARSTDCHSYVQSHDTEFLIINVYISLDIQDTIVNKTYKQYFKNL